VSLSYHWLANVTLRPTVSQSVCLDVEPHLGLMTRYVLGTVMQLLFCPSEALSLTRRRVCHLSESANSNNSVVSMYIILRVYMLLHCITLHMYIQYIQGLSLQAQYNWLCPVLIISLYNGSVVIWTVVCLTAA
jgi:hypothetical protein